MPISPDKTVTVTIGDTDGRINAAAFAKILEETLGMLVGLESAFVRANETVDWDIVRIRMNSPITITFEPTVTTIGRKRPNVSATISKGVYKTVAELAYGNISRLIINEEALGSAKKLIKTAATEGANVIVAAGKGSERIKLSADTIENINRIENSVRFYIDFSTIEGILDVVSVRGGKTFWITETLTNQRVECTNVDQFFSDAVAQIGKRVAVTGRVNDRSDTPRMIRVQEPLFVFPDQSTIPQLKDMEPIDITGGLSSEEFIRRARDA